jgi:hypothetical protein
MDGFDGRLEQLFDDYKASVAIPEAGAGFMPRLWEQIDARRNFAFRLKKLTQLFVAVSAALCLLMTGITVVSNSSNSRQPHATYVDVLAEAHPAENLAALGILAHGEGYEANH